MRAAAGPFSPRVVAEVNALACELPDKLGLPLSRFSRSELRRQVLAAGIVAAISRVTIWRWLLADALRPWSRRSWIFARDPQLAPKAGRVLDLYHRGWNGRALTGDDFVISADEKTQIPIQKPVSSDHATGARPTSRLGTCTAPSSSARSSARSPIVALDAQVMALEPYRSATRVFLARRRPAQSTAASAPPTVSRHNSTTSPWRICSSTRTGSTRDLAHGIVSPGLGAPAFVERSGTTKDPAGRRRVSPGWCCRPRKVAQIWPLRGAHLKDRKGRVGRG